MTLSKSKSQTQSSLLSFSVLICFDSRSPGGFSSNCAVLRSLAASLFSCCSCDSSVRYFSYFLYQPQVFWHRLLWAASSAVAIVGSSVILQLNIFPSTIFLQFKICLWTIFLNTFSLLFSLSLLTASLVSRCFCDSSARFLFLLSLSAASFLA